VAVAAAGTLAVLALRPWREHERPEGDQVGEPSG
jgi:hypothetical protein